MTELINSMGINRDVLLVVLMILAIVLIALVIFLLIRTNKVFQRYDMFMKGHGAKSLEDTVFEIKDRTATLQNQDIEQRDYIKKLTKAMASSYCKTGVVKYNAFNGMGGQSSFAIVLLDHTNTGFMLNAMHSRTSCFLYIKEIKDGKPESAFSDEEKEALDKAMNS